MAPQVQNTATVSVDNNANLLTSLIVPLIPWLLFFAVIWFFVFRQLRAKAGQAQKPMPVVIVNTEALKS